MGQLPLLFTPIELRGVTLKNRVVVAPMHQYAAEKGFATDWHLMNAGRYAAGGAGLVIMESTKVERRGCGTVGDLGLWRDEHIPGLKRCTDFIRKCGAVPGLQIAHSGRKSRRFRPWESGKPLTRAAAEAEGTDDWDAWELVSSSALQYPEDEPLPRALTRAEIPDLIDNWGKAARRADAAGFEVLEIHGAHGYLIHQFLSPFANKRNDEYGGTLANRMRFCLEIVEAVRANWPQEKPLFLRISCEDDMGWTLDDSVALAEVAKSKGVDVVDCSAGGMSGGAGARPLAYGYQVPFAERIRAEAGLMTMAVGLIVHADQAEAILKDGRADLIALARELLYNPNWPMDAAQKLGIDERFTLVPPASSYWLSRRAATAKGISPSTFRRGLGD